VDPTSVAPMFNFVQIKPYVNSHYERLSIAFKYAIAGKWARVNWPTLRNKNRPTVGEMIPPPEKFDTDV
jgi:hypothetical protein